MLEINDLSLAIGNFKIESVSLTIKEGLCHVILGPNGSGKTMLLESIVGLRRPDKGEILARGRDIINLPIQKRGFSYVPQDLALFPNMTVEENIFYGLKIRGKINGKSYELAEGLIETLGIGHLMKRSVTNLSGGERQKVAIMRGLAPGHKFLIVDEAFSALHEGMKKELWLLIKRLQKEYGLTILMITHNLEEAFFLGDEISIIIDGKIHQTGDKNEIYSHPNTEKVARFLGINNLFKCETRSIEKETLSVYCEELRSELRVPFSSRFGSIKKGQRVMAGIRAEEVMILRKEGRMKKQDNILTGVITQVYEKGSTHTLLFLPQGARSEVEIEMPGYALRKLQIKKGMGTTACLKKENIFLLESISLQPGVSRP